MKYTELNVKELKQLCKEKKLKKYSKLRKKELIKILIEYYTDKTNIKKENKNEIKNILQEKVKENGIVNIINEYKEMFEICDYKKKFLNIEINSIIKIYCIDYKRIKIHFLKYMDEIEYPKEEDGTGGYIVKNYKPLLLDCCGIILKKYNYYEYFNMISKKYNNLDSFDLDKNGDLVPYDDNIEIDRDYKYGLFSNEKYFEKEQNKLTWRREYKKRNGTPNFYNDFSFF